MTRDVIVRLEALPAHIRGFCVEKDSFYTIVINADLEASERLKVYEHEIRHIEQDDFHSDEDVDEIERRCHDSRNICKSEHTGTGTTWIFH